MDKVMSDTQSYVSSGDVPYPIISSLHVKDNESAAKFHGNIAQLFPGVAHVFLEIHFWQHLAQQNCGVIFKKV